jgi:glycosyltransferase involved in cell wall biosynthesis
VALTFAGDPSAADTWSGTPANLGRALRALGVTVEPLSASPARPVEAVAVYALMAIRLFRTPQPTLRDRARVSRTIARHTGPRLSALRTNAARRAIERATPLDAAIQLGTEYYLPAAVPTATFEDMTVAQAVTLPYPKWQLLTERERAARRDLQRRVYEQAVACCFATPWAAESAVEDYDVPQERVHVVGIGPNHTPEPVARDWRLPRFLWVGSDWWRKNGDAVVRAFVHVRDVVPGARLDLVGSHPRSLVDGVVGHGPLSLANPEERARLVALFQSATCFVMPSQCEPAGIAYVEAGTAGVPSIGSTVGGSAYLIGDGGCVVEPGDDGALVEAMRQLADADVARAAGARARTHVEPLAWPAVAQRVLAALGLDRGLLG